MFPTPYSKGAQHGLKGTEIQCSTLSSPLCLTRLEMKNDIFYLYSGMYFVITLAFTQKLLNSVKCTYAVLCG